MPDVDWGVASQIKPPTPAAGNDPFKILGTLSEIQKNRALTENIGQETAQRKYDLMSEEFGRAANDILMQPEGPKRTARWNHYVDDFHAKGFISAEEHAQWHNNPSNLVLNQAIAHSVKVPQHYEMTGRTAGLSAAARAPYEWHEMGPGVTAGYFPPPGGGPSMSGPPTGGGSLGGRPAPGGPPAGPLGLQGAAARPPARPTPTPAPEADSGMTQPSAPLAAAPSSKSTLTAQATPGELQGNTADTPARSGKQKPNYYGESPVTPVSILKPNPGKGVVQQAIDPGQVEARNAGIKRFDEDIDPTANTALKTKATLGSLRSELQSGKVSSDRFAELKMTVAGAIYGVTQNADMAKSLTGINLPWNEVFQKDATRMGLTFARQTEGAREAVQAIRIALLANPSILNTKEGNLKIIDMLEKGADYDVERRTAAHDYFQKQHDRTGMGHLANFDNWFGKNHPPSHFISKSVPYTLDPANMQHGATYEWTEKGKPQRGVFNADTQKMDPAR